MEPGGAGDDGVGGSQLAREGRPGGRVFSLGGGFRKCARGYGRSGDSGAPTAENRLVVGALVVRVEERLAVLDRPAEARPPAMLVSVAVGIATLDPRKLLVVGECVQARAVEFVEGGAVVGVAPAPGRDHDAREAPVLGAIRVGEDLQLGDRV